MADPHRGRLAAWPAIAIAVVAMGASPACSAGIRQKVLPALVDGVPPPGQERPAPPRRKVREELARENDELRRKLLAAQEALQAKEKAAAAPPPVRPVEKAATWEEAKAALPRDATGLVSWSQALEKDAVAPRSDPDPARPLQAILDLEVEVAHVAPAGSGFAVTFSHAPHTRWLSCGNCHPGVYPLGKRAAPVVATMKAMQQGRSCGACHGPVAFPLSACARCHPGNPVRADWRSPVAPARPIEAARTWGEAARLLPQKDNAPDWTQALAAKVIAPRPGIAATTKPEDTEDTVVTRVPGGDESAKTIFPHRVHTELLKCDGCHPAPYEMQGGATKMSMAQLEKGELCATCHGKVAFPIDACARCHPGM